MLGYKNVKAKALDNNTRLWRFYVIFISLAGLLLFLNSFFDVKMILLVYFLYPIIFLYSLKVAFAYLVLKKRRSVSLSSGSKTKYNKARTSIPDLLTKSETTSATLIDFITTLSYTVLTLIFFIISIAWVPLCLLAAMHNYPDTELVSDLVKVISDYYQNLSFMTPWPMILIYVIVLGIFTELFNVHDIHNLSHIIYQGKRNNDTGHNFIKIISSSSYTLLLFLLFVGAVYSSYILLTSLFGLEVIKGVTEFSLIYCFFSVFLIMSKRVRSVFTAMFSNKWSITKMFSLSAVILLAWIFIPTLFFNIFFSDSIELWQGSYNYQVFSLKDHFVFLIWTLLWFCLPVISHLISYNTSKYSIRSKALMTLLAFTIVYGLFSNQNISGALTKLLILITSNQYCLLLIPIIYTIIILYIVFRKESNRNLFHLPEFDSKKAAKVKSLAIAKYIYLFIPMPLLLALVIESIFLVSKLLIPMVVIYVCLLIYYMRGLIKISKASNKSIRGC